MVTIKDVSKLAGVSVATVSRALNESGYVSEKSRLKVEAAKIEDKNFAVIEKGINDSTASDLSGFDVVVNALGAPLGEEEAHVVAGRSLIEALKGTDTRAIIVGGAGSLFVDEGRTTLLVDTPEFPDIFKATANGQGRNLADLRNA